MKKTLSLFMAAILLISILSISAFAAETPEESGTVIYAADGALTRSEGYGVAHGYTDIKNDNHIFNKKVEVWCVAETWLTNYSSSTANGIPDWTLMAMCQLWVSNGDVGYITSPTSSIYDGTYTSATTKEVNAKDGGNASATGHHTVKDYYDNIVWNTETHATEKF